MNLPELQAIIDRIKYKNSKIKIRWIDLDTGSDPKGDSMRPYTGEDSSLKEYWNPSREGWALRLVTPNICNEGSNQPYLIGWQPIDWDALEDEVDVLNLIRDICLSQEIHETFEQVVFDGRIVFDPHRIDSKDYRIVINNPPTYRRAGARKYVEKRKEKA